ncbi:MAG: carboxypeptidase M32 [Rhodospirillaceae bacterium]|jgi:carboxypeptidase Taq
MQSSAYQKLEGRFRRLKALSEAEAILQWDLATMMPHGGAAGRAEQLAELKAVQHGILTAAEVADLIGEAESQSNLDAEQQANLNEIKRNWVHATALPEDLVIALSKAESACEHIWRTARANADFSLVRPKLEVLLSIVKDVASAKADQLNLSLYDALLDQYEPGMRSDEIDKEFSELESFLPAFLNRVLEHQARQSPAVQPQGPFPVKKQKALGMQFMQALGFDFDYGRLDVSLHPFSGGTTDDLRITTRYDESDFTSSLMGVLHETGHALYDKGLPKNWRSQPAGDARGMGMHESQSLLIEMQVCRSRAFLEYASPIIANAFNGAGPAWEVDNLYKLYTRVTPDFIRVDADEVTYPAHVIVRYRLEKAMIEGDLSVEDLPGAWNDLMKSLLGLTPPSDREGCLQDIHWYDGAWGYFPTYTLGAMMAAQIFQAATQSDVDIIPGIRQGNFKPLMSWLHQNIHNKGSLFSTNEILTQATGKPLDANVYKAHLENRYLN